MAFTILKIAFSAFVIAYVSWLSGRKPVLAGFLTALPLVSLLALFFSYLEHQDVVATTKYAKSIIFAVPVSWLFFAPFFFTEKFNLGFWLSYALGISLLVIGYFVHQGIIKFFG